MLATKKILSPEYLNFRLKQVYRIYKAEGFAGVSQKIKRFYANKKHSIVKINIDNNKQRSVVIEDFLEQDYKYSQIKVNAQSHYVPKALDSLEGKALPVKLIAYYLPQFHPFEENNEWWGEGFTEWTNVTKARPQYVGHNQPRLPGELGFYDLRLPQVMHQQIALAKQYGISGFCFHHYWFGGKRLMETPVNNFLADTTMDIEFCICWANENWTRRWDGSESDVLMAQNHSAEDDIAFLDDILPALKDPRYIRIDGKPVLILYRASLLPDAKATGQRWREHAKRNGLPGLYLVVVKAFEVTNPLEYDFDAIVEFPPHLCNAQEITDQVTVLNKDYTGKVYDYAELASRAGEFTETAYPYFKAVMPSWDNEARKPGRGFSFSGASPENYAKWLSSAIQTTFKNKAEERLLFINAWNEWAEGAHLEPDRYNGYAYLHATANSLRHVMNDFECDQSVVGQFNESFKSNNDSAVILHAYYEDLAVELVEDYISQHSDILDLIITIRKDTKRATLEKIKHIFPNVYFILVDNRGRDIRPFLSALKFANENGYKLICKVHTKKSPHRVDGNKWRESLFDDLLGSKSGVISILDRFERTSKIGLLGPKNSLTDLSIPEIHLGNIKWLNVLLRRMGSEQLSKDYKTVFPAGSMFWFRTDSLNGLYDKLVSEEEFELEAGQLDGTLAHSIERIIGQVVMNNGFSLEEV